jgi:hypothetical protein
VAEDLLFKLHIGIINTYIGGNYMHLPKHINPEDPYKSSYIWDGIEKRGFPVSEQVKLLDLEDLTNEERLVLAGDDVTAIEKIVAENGSDFLYVMSQNLVLFLQMISSLYEHESDEKKREILNVISSTINTGDEDE